MLLPHPPDRRARSLRAEPSRGPAVPALSIEDPALRAELAATIVDHPFAFLLAAGQVAIAAGDAAGDLIEELSRSPWPEAVALGAALRWLDGPVADVDPVATIGWLDHLDQAEVTGAWRRREGSGAALGAYLAEISLISGQSGMVYVRLDHDREGALAHALVADGTADELRSLIRWAERGRPVRSFRPIRPTTVRRALAAGLAAADADRERLDLATGTAGAVPVLRFFANELDDGDRPGPGPL